MSSCNPSKLPQINFSGLEPGTDEWAAVRSQVMEALEEFGCIEVVWDDKLTPELREAFMGKAIKEPFGLPFETKLRNNCMFQGYTHDIPYMDYEGLLIPKCDDPENADNFTKLMWGDEGNPSFRETVSKFMRVMKEVDEMVVKMVFESYGVEKYLDSHLKTNVPSFRLSHYGASKTQQGTQAIQGMGKHTDPVMTAIVCQHEQEGLEIQLKDGSWATPSKNSINFLLGDCFWVWSNGRLQPPYHRVQMTGSVDRYTTVYSSVPNDEIQIQALKEFVDEKHPLLFKPFYHKDYLSFRFSEPGMKAKCPLNAFLGTEPATDEQLKV